MKKSILFMLVILCATFTYAQLGFGIKGAITMNKLSGDLDDYSNAAKTGFQLGAFVRVGEKVHLQPEVYYSLRSGEMKFNYSQTDASGSSVVRAVNQTGKFHTIDIPVLLGVRVLKLPKLDVRVQAGPVASFIVSKSFDVTFDGIEVDDDDSPIIADDFSNVNWGLQFGGGIDFLFLTADIRYELGLNNVYKSSSATTDDPTLKSNIFFLSLGFKIL
jgi:hypothetical protein